MPEAGQALLFVLIALALLMSIPLAIATTTVDQLPQTTRNLNWDAAYEAAQAGLNDFLQDLDSSGQSYLTSCTKAMAQAGTCNNTALYTWRQVATNPLEYYSYTPSVVPATGLVSLKVSGEADDATKAKLKELLP